MFSLLGQPRAGVLVAAIASVAIASPVCAQEREQRQTFNIPAQSLASALIEFSRQSDVMVVVDPSLVNGRTAPAVQGEFTTQEALTRLLAGSTLTPTRQPDGGFVLAGNPIQLGDASSAASSEDDIVVTARKREELVQDVPASITALGGAALDRMGAEGFEDFVRLAPGLTMNPTSTNPNFSIRGISTSTTLGTTQQPIALYVDDTPTQDPFVALSSLNLYLADISRVEVLRGPQGTLFGSGSLSGAIRVITRTPDPSEFSAYVEAGASTIEGGEPGTQLEAMINAPLGDTTALRAVAYRRHVGGYIDNSSRGIEDVNDYTVQGGRIALQTELTPNFSVTGSIIHQRDEGDDGSRTFYTPSQGGSDEWSSLQADDTQFETTIGNILASYDLGWATLTSSTSHLMRDESTH
ncbi:MAG TPA: TonB-dependent receptor plug domain-containing protein, partial [Verrucomicrobiae bacterium]|nr:TonB-dependent receptor plug domain-containing protein [Verrucomicrobiae bacterium]